MIDSPFRFELVLGPEDLHKFGLLSLRWALIDHVITNCLKALKGLTDDEAIDQVFPLFAKQKMEEIKELIGSRELSAEANEAYRELMNVMSGVRVVRDAVTHGTIMTQGSDVTFEHRSRGRKFTRGDVLETEEMTNYAAHAAVILRHELGDIDPDYTPGPLPRRPPIPKCLKPFIGDLGEQTLNAKCAGLHRRRSYCEQDVSGRAQPAQQSRSFCFRGALASGSRGTRA
jgi:hypothetical protein